MLKLGYKPEKKDNEVAMPCCGSDPEGTIYPDFSIRGKNLKLAKLDKMVEVGECCEARVKLKVKSISKSDSDSEYANDICFEVHEFSKEGADDADKEQEEYEKNLTGSAVSKKKKKMTAKDSLGDY
jgi:hypothetical protein